MKIKNIRFLLFISFFTVNFAYGYFSRCTLPPSKLRKVVEQFAEQFASEHPGPNFYLWRQAYTAYFFVRMKQNMPFDHIREIESINVVKPLVFEIRAGHGQRLCSNSYYFRQAVKDWEGQAQQIEQDWKTIKEQLLREQSDQYE